MMKLILSCFLSKETNILLSLLSNTCKLESEKFRVTINQC